MGRGRLLVQPDRAGDPVRHGRTDAGIAGAAVGIQYGMARRTGDPMWHGRTGRPARPYGTGHPVWHDWVELGTQYGLARWDWAASIAELGGPRTLLARPDGTGHPVWLSRMRLGTQYGTAARDTGAHAAQLGAANWGWLPHPARPARTRAPAGWAPGCPHMGTGPPAGWMLVPADGTTPAGASRPDRGTAGSGCPRGNPCPLPFVLGHPGTWRQDPSVVHFGSNSRLGRSRGSPSPLPHSCRRLGPRRSPSRPSSIRGVQPRPAESPRPQNRAPAARGCRLQRAGEGDDRREPAPSPSRCARRRVLPAFAPKRHYLQGFGARAGKKIPFGTGSEGSEPEESSKSGSKKLDAMTLIKEDMSIFGHCPAHDEFYLVVCNHCSQVVKPQAFQKHCERRHGPLSKLYARAGSGPAKCHAVNGQPPACGAPG
uniref:Ataxin 7-like 2 n=1 Tax=Apteryx owenii TaxID=8824 RepID=A0A8B9QJG3_APTOW